MTQEEAQDKARNNFKSGMNCAQSVFSVFAEELGMNLETALKVSQGFGGGMCRMREVCGCVSAMIMASSLVTGSADPSDNSARNSAKKTALSYAVNFSVLFQWDKAKLPCKTKRQLNIKLSQA